jgi:hypothetical protein
MRFLESEAAGSGKNLWVAYGVCRGDIRKKYSATSLIDLII